VRGQNQTITALAGVDELRTDVVQLEKKVLSMQSRNRALLDELDNPMNVHRWGSPYSACSTEDPGIFYQKIIKFFVTVNGQGHFLPEGPGGGKGYKDRFAVFNLAALRAA
jgi:hypothetical protein